MPRGNKFKNVPDRWIDYEPFKEIIRDIKIVPFKVPLPIACFKNNFLMNHKWTPFDVMEAMPDLGLVIDLTFKYPCYYEPLEFLENGIDYTKIGCAGHVIPPRETFLKFCDTVDNFLRDNPDRIVGVHCTHGVNRTGYMICRYMVERRGYAAYEALRMFAEMRGYELERENYRREIYHLERT